MSDYGDFCREQRERRQRARRAAGADNWRFVEQMLGLGFAMATVGAGYRFTKGGTRIDFWPSTAKWNVVGAGDYHVGGAAMIKHAKSLGGPPATGDGERYTLADPRSFWPGLRASDPNSPPWDNCPCPTCKEK